MNITITTDSKMDTELVESLEGVYGRQVDAQEKPTQTDEEYVGWAFKRFLKESIRTDKIEKYKEAIEKEDIIL